MKKHTLYLIIIILFILFLFLCYSDSPLNAESPRWDRGIVIPPLQDLGLNKNDINIMKGETTFYSEMWDKSKLYSLNNPNFIQIPDKTSVWKMPEMIVRNDIDYKILEMQVDSEVDYKILDVFPIFNVRVNSENDFNILDAFPKSKYIKSGILLNN